MKQRHSAPPGDAILGSSVLYRALSNVMEETSTMIRKLMSRTVALAGTLAVATGLAVNTAQAACEDN